MLLNSSPKWLTQIHKSPSCLFSRLYQAQLALHTTAQLPSCLPALQHLLQCCMQSKMGLSRAVPGPAIPLPITVLATAAESKMCSQKDFAVACIMRTILRFGSLLLCIHKQFGNDAWGSKTKFSCMILQAYFLFCRCEEFGFKKKKKKLSPLSNSDL